MIERIINIENLGRFARYSASGNVTMSELTLIYGENGRGKTTLCSLFRSMMSGNVVPLLARQTLGQANQPTANIRITGQNLRLHNGAWSATFPDLAIFDSEFVHQNIYSGDHVARDQRRNSYHIIIGAQGVQLAQQIDQIDRDIRDANSNLRDLRQQVQRHIIDNTSVDDFLQIQAIADVDAQIQLKEAEVETIETRTQQATQIQAKAVLESLPSPTLPTDVAEVLGKTVPDVSAEAEARVREHIQSNLDAQGESWLSRGAGYATGPDCPFCGQDLEGNDLIAHYRSYFNEAYSQLKLEVTTLPNLVNPTLRGNSITDLARTLAANAERMAFWARFTDLALPQVPTEQLQETFSNAATSMDIAIAAKQAAPLDAIPMPEDWPDIEAQVNAVREAVDAYNQKVEEINVVITQLKQPQAQGNLNAAKAELQRLQQAKKRHEPAVVADCAALTAEIARKNQLDGQKVAVKQQLDQYCATVLQTHQDEINRYLDQFNTSFRITNTRHNYVGGTPSSQFQIQINNETVDLGDDRTPDNTPSFKTALSTGDRSALALAFFLATLKRDPNVAQKVVVLDDPFSSQDRFRRASTQYLIARLAADAAQVIVLSHDPHFLKAVEDDTQGIGIARLQTVQAGEVAGISTCDLDAIIGCPLSRDRTLLGTYVSVGQGNPLDVARAIRVVLEGYLRQAAPGAFTDANMLGDMVSSIRASTTEDPINRFDPIVDELDQINRYARNFHHPPGAQQPTPQIDGAELQGYARRTLRIVGGI